MHAVLQAVDLFADLRVHGLRGRPAVGMTVAGSLQIALERFESFVQSLQVSLEFVLTAVGDRQHQGGEIVEDR